MNETMRKFVRGLLVGMVSRGVMPTEEKVPIQYLYGHEAEKTVSYAEITWDGDTTGLTEQSGFYKVSDAFFTAQEVLGGSFTLHGQSGSITFPIVAWFDSEGNGGFADGYSADNLPSVYAMAYQANDSAMAISVSSASSFYYVMSVIDDGTYFLDYSATLDDCYTSALSYPNGCTYEEADVYINGVGYVGAVLPALPEWDRESYPYAVIVATDTIAFLYATKEKPYMNYGTEFRSEDILTWLLLNGAWGNPYDTDTYIRIDKATWSNCDIYDADGNLLIGASDPIPVYE